MTDPNQTAADFAKRCADIWLRQVTMVGMPAPGPMRDSIFAKHRDYERFLVPAMREIIEAELKKACLLS